MKVMTDKEFRSKNDYPKAELPVETEDIEIDDGMAIGPYQIKIFTGDESSARIDSWLPSKDPSFSRSYIQGLLSEGKIAVNGRTVKANYRVRPLDYIEMMVPKPEALDVVAEEIPLEILYEDSDIIVVNKPKGMVVHPAPGVTSGTMVNALLWHCGNTLSDINGIIRPGIVHRIDKDTTGILVVAKNNKAHEFLSEKFKDHNINRIYTAIVDGVIREEQGKINAPVGRHPTDRKRMAVNLKNGRRAITHFKVLERFKGHTLIELRLETGRTHQIRVHMSYIGHPVTGDTVYGRKSCSFNLEGQALHAKLLGFIHPVKGEYVEFSVEAPEYFKELVKKLRQNIV